MKNDESDEANTCVLFRLGSRISCRRVLNIMVFLGFMVNYMLRVNLTFAIVYMIFSSGGHINSSNDNNNSSLAKTIINDTFANNNRTRRDTYTLSSSTSEEKEMLPMPSALFGFGSNDRSKPDGADKSESGLGDIFKKADSIKNKTGSSLRNLVRTNSRMTMSSSNQSDNRGNERKFKGVFGDDFELPLSKQNADHAEINSTTIADTTTISTPNDFSTVRQNRVTSGPVSISQSSPDKAEIFFANDNKQFNPSVISDNLLSDSSVNVTTDATSPEAVPSPSVKDSNGQTTATTTTSTTSTITNTDRNSDGVSISDSEIDNEAPGTNDDVVKNRLPIDDSELSSDGAVTESVSVDNLSDSKPISVAINSEYLKNYNKFTWSEKKQGVLLGSFFWGYVCTELPGGRLAELIGARSVFGYATLGASVVTLLTPLSAKINFFAVVTLRVVLGILLGPTWPSVLPLAAKWIPPNERGKFMSNMMASTLGAAFTLPVCSFIIETSSWEYVFYVTGLIGFLWSLCWFVLVYDSPADHPRITTQERRYIESQLKINKHRISFDEEKYDTSDGEEKQTVPSPSSARNNSNAYNQSSADGENRELDRLEVTDETNGKSRSENDSDNDKDCANIDESEGEIITAQVVTRDADTISFGSGKRNGRLTDGHEKTNSPIGSTVSPNNNNNNNRNGSLTSSKRSKSSIRKGTPEAPLSQTQNSHANAPWLQIVTSLPVWAFVVTHTASVFGYNTITVQLPTYMKHILHYDIKSNGILSSLPYLGKYIMAIVAGSIADTVVKSNMLSKTAIRKLFTALAVMIPGIFMLLQVYLGSDKIISIIIFTAALTVNGLVTGGYLGNTLDLAPNYSGTIFGLGNMFSSAGGAVSALLVGFLTNDNQVYGQWQIVFWIVGFIYIGGASFFLLFGTADTQPWDSPDGNKSKDVEADNRVDSYNVEEDDGGRKDVDTVSDYGSAFYNLFYGVDYDNFYDNSQKWV